MGVSYVVDVAKMGTLWYVAPRVLSASGGRRKVFPVCFDYIWKVTFSDSDIFALAPRDDTLKLQNIKVWQYGQVGGPAQPGGSNMMRIEKSKNPILDLRLGSSRWHSIRQ